MIAMTMACDYILATKPSVASARLGLNIPAVGGLNMSVHPVAHGAAILQPVVTCRICGSNKKSSEFYNRQVRKCGLVGECKDCTKARVRARSRSNPSVQQYDRQRAALPHRRANAAKTTAEWRKKNPQAYKAQTAVSNAIRDGHLKKLPCAFCGAGRVHAHHRDYGKPLDVIWLCPKCHHRLHAMFPEVEGVNKRAYGLGARP